MPVFESKSYAALTAKNPVEYIKIIGLFSEYDITLPFQNNINIYIGENGLGKTTILNIIYFLLSRRFRDLVDIKFTAIEIKFVESKTHHKVYKEDIVEYYSKQKSSNPFAFIMDKKSVQSESYDYIKRITDEYTNYISEKKKEVTPDEFMTVMRTYSEQTGLEYKVARQHVMRFFREYETEDAPIRSGDPKRIVSLSNDIKKCVTGKILYLPTFRRIESNIKNIDDSEICPDKFDSLMRFGMQDVKNIIDNLLEVIRTDALNNFNRMTGVLIQQYSLATDEIRNHNPRTKFDIHTLQIVLDRIGNAINPTVKSKIQEMHLCGELYTKEYNSLYRLIEKLIESYSSQRVYDEKLNAFVSTCNKYLSGKKLYYNQNAIDLNVQHTNASGELTSIIEFDELSSGEKQIVSLFAQLYLYDDTSIITLIDEPELSLSIRWQKMLLPDIMASNKCSLLIATTHSPFIFNNEYEEDAIDIRKNIISKKGSQNE